MLSGNHTIQRFTMKADKMTFPRGIPKSPEMRFFTTHATSPLAGPWPLSMLLLLWTMLGMAAVAVDAYDPFESNVKANFNASTINKFHPTMSMSFAQVRNTRRSSPLPPTTTSPGHVMFVEQLLPI